MNTKQKIKRKRMPVLIVSGLPGMKAIFHDFTFTVKGKELEKMITHSTRLKSRAA